MDRTTNRETIDEKKALSGSPYKIVTGSDLDSQLSLLNSNVVIKSFGVRKAEVLMEQYTSYKWKALYFFSIFVAMYVNQLDDQVTGVFIGYATNSYEQHSLMATIGIVRKVIAVAALPAYARLSDIFGRFELFIFSLIFRIIGTVIKSQARDVQRYSGGEVLYSIGFSGSRILWQINLSDASSLQYRILTIAILNLPAIINTWSSGEIVNSLLDKYDWSFGIALWAFTFPLACFPYLACSLHMRWKAGKTEEWKLICEDERNSYARMNVATQKHKDQVTDGGNKFWGNIKIQCIRAVYLIEEVFWKVDLIGSLLIICILGLMLVPLTLAGGTRSTWTEASTLAPIIIGFALIPGFIFWEWKLARNPLIPLKLLKDRGIWASFAIAILYTFVSTMPNSYAYPVLLVGMNASEVVATRTPLLLHFVVALTLPALGLVLSWVRRTKGFVIFGICVWFIAMGLFVHFRGDNNGINAKYYRDGVAIGMCLLGFGQGFFNRIVSVSAQTCTNHEYMAAVTGMFTAIYQIGGAFGKCVSGAIWTQNMYNTIKEKMVELGVDLSLAKDAYLAPYTFIEEHKWELPLELL